MKNASLSLQHVSRHVIDEPGLENEKHNTVGIDSTIAKCQIENRKKIHHSSMAIIGPAQGRKYLHFR